MTTNLLVFDTNTLSRNGIVEILNKGNHNVTVVDMFVKFKEKVMKEPFTHLLVHIDENISSIIDLFGKKKVSFSKIPIMFYSDNNLSFQEHYLKKIPNYYYMDIRGTDDSLNNAIMSFLTHELTLKSGLPNPFEKLTARQLEIIKEINKGKKVTEIATTLKLRSNTISTVKKIAFSKLNIGSIRDLTILAIRHNMD